MKTTKLEPCIIESKTKKEEGLYRVNSDKLGCWQSDISIPWRSQLKWTVDAETQPSGGRLEVMRQCLA